MARQPLIRRWTQRLLLGTFAALSRFMGLHAWRHCNGRAALKLDVRSFRLGDRITLGLSGGEVVEVRLTRTWPPRLELHYHANPTEPPAGPLPADYRHGLLDLGVPWDPEEDARDKGIGL